MPVAGGAGVQAMTALRARVTAGDPPTAVQMLGFDIRDWAEMGVLGNLNDLANEQGWDKVIPAALQEFSQYEGNWIAAPVNVQIGRAHVCTTDTNAHIVCRLLLEKKTQ